MTISACVITRDEKVFLEKCLPAAKASADQLIVVDTGSSDGSVKVAKKYADVVETLRPRVLVEKGFAYVRNLAASFATGDWIYQVDADEMLSAEQRPELRRLCETTDAVALRLKVLTFENSRSNPKYWEEIANTIKYDVSTHVRVYRNTPRIRWEGYIHEELFENGVVPCFSSALATDLKHLHFTRYRRGGGFEDKELRFSYMLTRAHDDRNGLGRFMNQWWWDNWFPNNIGPLRLKSAQYLQQQDRIDPL